MRAQKLLEQNGIRSQIRKLTHDASAGGGCIYAVEVAGNPGPAVQIITAAGIRVLGVTN